jgi:hypothetical protein
MHLAVCRAFLAGQEVFLPRQQFVFRASRDSPQLDLATAPKSKLVFALREARRAAGRPPGAASTLARLSNKALIAEIRAAQAAAAAHRPAAAEQEWALGCPPSFTRPVLACGRLRHCARGLGSVLIASTTARLIQAAQGA